jgi:hypothetical protein
MLVFVDMVDSNGSLFKYFIAVLVSVNSFSLNLATFGTKTSRDREGIRIRGNRRQPGSPLNFFGV